MARRGQDVDTTARVLSATGRNALVSWKDLRVVVSLRGKLKEGRRRTKHVLAPGDWVRLSDVPKEPSKGTNELAIEEVLPRRNCISRSSAGGRYEQVLYANIDLLVVVGSVFDPSLSPGLFDRFLVVAEREGIPSALVINKVDLGVPDRALDVIEIYRKLGYPVVSTCASTGVGLEELRSLLDVELAVFAGQSGVGKSSLLNRLMPGFDQLTAEVSVRSRQGRHTTTRTLLAELSPGHHIADTPGVRSFALHDFTPDEIAFGFREMAPLASSCRFKGCTHVHEPGCAVLAALESRDISSLRYESYRRILDSRE